MIKLASITLIIIALLIGAVICFGGEPTPPTGGPPPLPVSAPASTNDTGTITLTAPELPVGYEWELSFEWRPSPDSTNVVIYPIRIQVPFEHDHGTILIRAKKVRK